MKRLWILPALVLTAGCETLNPVLRYQEAARQLRFSLERADPHVDVVFPLERSSFWLRLEVGVDNPSDQRLRTRRVSGNLGLAAQGEQHAIGVVRFPEGVDIAPGGHSTLKVDLAMNYADVQKAWGPLTRAVLRREPAVWNLAGEARFEVMGLEFGVPFRVEKGSGR